MKIKVNLIHAIILLVIALIPVACNDKEPETSMNPEDSEQFGTTDNPFGDESGGKHLKRKKFINESFSDNYDLYIEFLDESYYKYYAMHKKGTMNEKDTITNNGRNCSFLRKYYSNEGATEVVFDGPKSKWIQGAYHTPLNATIDKDGNNLTLLLYLEFHKRNPRNFTVEFERL